MAQDNKAFTQVDLDQCQAEKPNGHSFMTLGGRPGLVRCTNKPSVIITEDEPGIWSSAQMIRHQNG